MKWQRSNIWSVGHISIRQDSKQIEGVAFYEHTVSVCLQHNRLKM